MGRAKPPGPALHPKLAWIALISAGLTLLALLSGGQRPMDAAVAFITPTESPPGDWPFATLSDTPAPPLYRLTVDPAALAWLYDNPHTYDTVPAVFTFQGTGYDVRIRFRGGTGRDLPKKSWKIEFPASTLFQGQRELNLNAEYTDKSLLREILAYDLFARAGLPTSSAQYACLEINGQYMGLFVQVEQVDQRLLERIGWDPNGNLYKGSYGNFELSNDYLAYQRSYLKRTNREDSHDDVIAFVEMINYTPVADFPATLSAVMDVGTYLDWVAVHILLGDFEWVEKNYYIHHQLGEDRWAFLPWDLDLLLGHNWHWGPDSTLDPDITWDNPIDSGTWWSKKADGKWNKLVTEVLRNEDFKFAYCRRLRELMHGEFATAIMFGRIDTFYNQIIPYAEADPYKWGSNADFHYGPTELKTYVSNRLAWLADQMPGYCPASGPMPLINELMTDNQTTLADEAGEYEPWIELYNPGLVSFDVGGMTLQAFVGHADKAGNLSYRATPSTTVTWTIPAGTLLPPQGFVLIWADGEPGEGPLHADLRLEAGGGRLLLFDKAVHGGQVVDQLDYGPLAPDLPFGRATDGGPLWTRLGLLTPGWSNRGRPPLITDTAHAPAEPGAGQLVTVTAVVSDVNRYRPLPGAAPPPEPAPGGHAVYLPLVARGFPPLRVSLHWAADGTTQVSPMYDDGAHGDGAPADGRYGALLPALGDGTVVTYHVVAEHAAGLVSSDPPRAPAVTYNYIVGFYRPPLYLNELVAINQDTFDDEAGESDDWFEIYNAGPTVVNLGGMYLTDALENSTKWQIPAGVSVPPGGHLLLWADDQPEQGPTHVNFKLDGDGERLALYAGPEGYNGLIDEIYYGPQTVNQPCGRYPDGGVAWRALLPTPGQANRQPPPLISGLGHAPLFPLAGQAVTVSASIHDDGAVLSATLFYSAGLGLARGEGRGASNEGRGYSPRSGAEWEARGEWVFTSMQPITGELYSAQIPPQADGVVVSYYVQAQDNLGELATYPVAAPAVTYGYRVGYTPPPLFINEFLASNDAVNRDEMGEYEDWVELHNTGDVPLDVGGMYLTDDLSRPTRWRLPDGTLIPARGFLLIWTDDDEGDGPLHASFKLSKEGEEIGLFDRDAAANALIDSVLFGPQATDVSAGRWPDGGATWTTFLAPTPGENNGPP